MKEFIIIMVILILIIGGGIYVQKYLEKSTVKIKDELQSLKTTVQNTENITELIGQYETIYQMWQEEKERWSIFVLHDEIDEIEEYLTNIKSSLETNDKNQTITKIDISIFAINHIKEKEELSLINIF